MLAPARPRHPSPFVERLAMPAMGTRFEFVLVGDDSLQTRGHLRAAGEAALDEIRAWHDRLTRFEPASPVARAGALAGTGHGVRVDADFASAIQLAEAGWRQTAGAFDITLGTGGRDAARRPRVDPDGALRLAAGVALDFGALGKGLALDAAAAVLRDAGITDAFLHGGTSSGVALGFGPTGPWRVRLGETGNEGDGDCGVVVELRDAAFSASRLRVQRSDRGPIVPHTIDPRSGQRGESVVPREARPAGLAAVVADSAAWAEVWSTAAVVLGGVPWPVPATIRAAYVVPETPRDSQPQDAERVTLRMRP